MAGMFRDEAFLSSWHKALDQCSKEVLEATIASKDRILKAAAEVEASAAMIPFNANDPDGRTSEVLLDRVEDLRLQLAGKESALKAADANIRGKQELLNQWADDAVKARQERNAWEDRYVGLKRRRDERAFWLGGALLLYFLLSLGGYGFAYRLGGIPAEAPAPVPSVSEVRYQDYVGCDCSYLHAGPCEEGR